MGLGFATEFADAYLAMQAATVTVPAVVTQEVNRILGRPAETFAAWADRFRAEFTHTESAPRNR
ncbi:NAD(P)H azoreductase [Mycobacteroides abscessus subsp. massiliense]|nr:NAD(P)H azoreductase [Mycobacteroides abscessus subsp. massiliense]